MGEVGVQARTREPGGTARKGAEGARRLTVVTKEVDHHFHHEPRQPHEMASENTEPQSFLPLRLDREDALLCPGETRAAWEAVRGICGRKGPQGRASGRERVNVAAGRMRCRRESGEREG